MLSESFSRSMFSLLIFIFIALGACKNSRLNKLEGKEGRFMAKIATSAGDHINRTENDTLNFLAYPFNVAEFQGNRDVTKTVFLIGTSIDQGANVSFLPIAKLTYNDGNERTVIIGRPTNQKYITAEMENYYDLISTHYGVQKMIETWLTYARGFGSLKSIKWENEDNAMLFLES